jgi:hypothetical protein
MQTKKKVAAIITEYRPVSHADVLVGKIMEGNNYDHKDFPNLTLASMYIDQHPRNDLSWTLSKKYGVPIFDTIEDALTLGDKDLAVEGVLSIGEHGTYPENEMGQYLYPRRRFFAEICKVFERHGKAVPVFNDKHLAATWEDSKWMYDRARQLFVPLMAGSSLPVTYRMPALTLERGCELQEAVQIGYGGEAYAFHALESLQCIAERRKGFETGVRSVRAYRGKAMWKTFDQEGWSKDLLEAALAHVPEHAKGDYRSLTAKNKSAFLILLEYWDGFRAAVAQMDGYVYHGGSGAFAFAGRLKGQPKPVGTHFFLQEPFPFYHFAWLLKAIDSMIQTGHPPYPVERTLLTSGMLDAAMKSLYEEGDKIETPYLAIKYKPTDWGFASGPIPKGFTRYDG